MTDTALETRRHLPYTPDAVYAAFADPACLATWWGPDGFTTTFDVFDFVPGGRWDHVMHGPDGTDYPNRSVFAVLEPGLRVVIEHVNAPLFTLTVTLVDADGGTDLHWHQDFRDPAVAAALRAICEPSNEQNLDRLHAALQARRPTAG
jgi:uncharacterized protein YndB with AHSA1/START domain